MASVDAVRLDDAHPQRRGISLARACLIVLLVAVVVRVLALGGTSLVVENDGIDYLVSAETTWKLQPIFISPFRTPGYPAILALCFWLMGQSGEAVMIVQHALGALMAVLITRLAARWVPPAFAIVPGLLVAIDPTLLLFGSVMQTESVSMFLFVLIVSLALADTRRLLVTAAALGCVLAFANLVRPAFIVVAPFTVLALASRPALRIPHRVGIVAVAILAFSLTVLPWLAFNRERGIKGFSAGAASTLWVSLVQQDLLDRTYPLPPDVARRYAPVARHRGASAEMWTFLATPADTIEQQYRMPKLTTKWAIDSIQSDPVAYLARLPYSFLWQMNYFPIDGFILDSQITWFSYMVSCDIADFGRSGSNLHFDSNVRGVDVRAMSMSARGGWMRTFYRWWGLNHPRGFPQLPLCGLAIGAGILAIYRRDWPFVLVLLASAALVGVHVLMLFHQGRYSLPAVTVWYATAVVVPAAMLRAARGSEAEILRRRTPEQWARRA